MKIYLSTDEFVLAYARGLRAFLEKSFPDDENKTSHIEDLMASAATYSDATFHFVTEMPNQPKCKCKND